VRLSRTAIAWNLGGLTLPLGFALFAIPQLLAHLEKERFGLLSLAWSLTAVAGLFDLGVGRAATVVIARHLAKREGELAAAAIMASRRLAVYTGLAGCGIFAVTVLAGATELLSVSIGLRAELRESALILALAIPFQVGIAAARGICEATHQFRAISIIRIAMGIGNFGGPLLVSFVSQDLRALTGSLVLTRAASWIAHLRLASTATGHTPRADEVKPLMRELLHTGGWVTVSSVVSPLLVQSDRFVIGSVLSSSDVAAYSVPAELVLQLLVLASATSTVLFPNLAGLVATDQRGALRAFRKTAGLIAGQMVAVCGIAALAMPVVLPWWVDGQLAESSVRVGQILCIGVVFNAVGMVCAAFVHAHRLFRATAVTHIAELVLYLPAVTFLVRAYGLTGAAIAWSGRVAVDTFALLWLAQKTAPREPPTRFAPTTEALSVNPE
jgi:O-antigen/teichoic acid export membrane protein